MCKKLLLNRYIIDQMLTNGFSLIFRQKGLNSQKTIIIFTSLTAVFKATNSSIKQPDTNDHYQCDEQH